MGDRDCSVYISIRAAAEHVGLSPRTVRRYVEEGLVSAVITTAELCELRRVRRLRELGVNVAGIEIILNMRRQILELRREIARLERTLASME
ncbi:MAG: MerR family transcriptional regulator [Chloroflexi bacterium]|nr:MerR family transcriptional regulator [Chloroflexota bacterium]